jgi:hypothetical protein
MIDVTDLTKYAECHLILTALVRAGNRQAQVIQDAIVTDRDAERVQYYAMLDAVNQAQIACDRALLAIAQAVVASDTPFSDVANMLRNAGLNDTSLTHPLASVIFNELTALTKEAR